MRAKKSDIVHKLKIARGQIDGILQMVEEDRYCVDISTQLQSTQALLKSANQQIMQAHIRSCVREALQTDVENPTLTPGAERDLSLFAPSCVSDWIGNPAVWSEQTFCNLIYFYMVRRG